MLTQKYLYVKPPLHGRQLVITDIHGSLKTLLALLEKVKFEHQDQLLLLGDYINKGADSKGVLDLIIELQRQKYSIFALRGNHEDMLLESHFSRIKRIEKPQEFRRVPVLHKGRGLIDEQKLLKPAYFELLSNLPFYIETEKYFLVHAGFKIGHENKTFSKEIIFNDESSMLWIRNLVVSSFD